MNLKKYLILGCLSLWSCAPTIDYRGKQPELEDLEKIKVNQHTQEDVLSIIGSPTSTNLYGETKWFYVFKRTESTSFFDPKIKQEQIITIGFDQTGKVNQILSNNDFEKSIEPITNRTPTQGSNDSILQQIFGNFGRHIKGADADK